MASRISLMPVAYREMTQIWRMKRGFIFFKLSQIRKFEPQRIRQPQAADGESRIEADGDGSTRKCSQPGWSHTAAT